MRTWKIERREQIREVLERVEREFTGAPLAIRVMPWSNHRTIEQNRMLWATYESIAEFMSQQHAGEITADHVHEFCRSKFAPPVENPLMSITRKSTAHLTRAEFSDYYEQCCAWAAAMGWVENEVTK